MSCSKDENSQASKVPVGKRGISRMNKKIRILIVDDVSINRQILSALFDAEYEILEADDGTTALEVLE